ncbi:hypothetical protein AB0L65_33320 [Nonomuraea sp. NPDC052116]|uniref:hypothetical protein n=1 Tax=Nonomuraea sp. NPDC052116 TaxID=3155665 RepID=UPI00344613A1
MNAYRLELMHKSRPTLPLGVKRFQARSLNDDLLGSCTAWLGDLAEQHAAPIQDACYGRVWRDDSPGLAVLVCSLAIPAGAR